MESKYSGVKSCAIILLGVTYFYGGPKFNSLVSKLFVKDNVLNIY